MNLIDAVKNGKTEEIKLLLEDGADVNFSNNNKSSLLILASRYSNTTSNIETVKLLLENGADVNLKNINGATALTVASRNSNTESNIETVKLLLENGADVNLKDKDDWTALMLASRYSNAESNIETVKLLLENGADVNLKNNDGWTALMLASLNPNNSSNIETVKLLLENGANPFILKNNKKDALSLCRTEECREIIRSYIWKSLYNRDISTAKKYSKQTPLPADIWELILLNKRQQQLCKDLSSDKNKEILALFALELNIPINKEMTKGKLCGIISRHLAYGKYYSEKSKIYTEDKIEKEKNQIKKIARNFNLDVNRPIDEILKDLSFLF